MLKKIRFILFNIFLAIITLILFSEYRLQKILNSDKEIPIPNLVGLDILDAFVKIKLLNQTLKKKIKIDVEPVLNNHYVKYLVVKQYPNPQNLKIKEGRSIRLLVSKGSLSPAVPQFEGLDFRAVQNALKGEQIKEYFFLQEFKKKLINIFLSSKSPSLKLKKIKESISIRHNPSLKPNILYLGNIHFVYDEKIKKGHIIKQNPKAGTAIYDHIPIHFLISKGPRELFKVGNYKNQAIEKVYKILLDRNMKVSIENVPIKNKKSDFEGYIADQNFKKDDLIPIGSKIILKVFQKDKWSPYKCFQFQVPKLNDKKEDISEIRILHFNKNFNKEETLFSGYKKPFDQIESCIKSFQKKDFVKVYINNEFAQNLELK